MQEISPLPDCVKIIFVYPRPTTVRELRCFLSLLNFYQQFSLNAAAVQAELHGLIKSAVKKDATPITWTDSLAASIEECKNLILQTTLLFYLSKEQGCPCS
ncbi:hypothetical protein TNCT_262331 [Trichonephila clavata]|uniref:Uncharacterized protein n=1 Tax=Trichonephila clavata TaxID=2740835 RepID=A0A8X6F3B0_TRICU|nr:hypothetical protein TNCT_262331 [Trichonephila clavata]